MAKLVFFDKDHTYEVDGTPYPSVSEILRFVSREIYNDINQYTLDNAANRGTRIHKATENLDRYTSCEADTETEPYINAYIQFLKDYKPKWEKIEHALFSSNLGYAGTLDRVGIINNKRTIIDLKSNSSPNKTLVGAQLNAYKILAEENDIKIDMLYCLQLKKDGKYKLIEHEIDDSIFKSCLTLHNALKKKRRTQK